jgi:hypothetical protein
MKSCQLPRTSGLLQITVPLERRYIVEPFTYISKGGEPELPEWCHWVNSCQVLAIG